MGEQGGHWELCNGEMRWWKEERKVEERERNHDSCFFFLSFACCREGMEREGWLEQIIIQIHIHNTSSGEKTGQVDWFSE
jgi:hypothetical protein